LETKKREEEKAYSVAETEGGLRLDRWLRRYFPHLPQSFFEKQLRGGRIRLNGSRAQSSCRISVGDTITLRLPPETFSPDPLTVSQRPVSEATKKTARLVPQWIVYEDAWLWILNKPAGLATQGGTKLLTSVDQAMNFWLKERGERAYLVHRLDKETTGLLVVARSPEMAALLGGMLARREVSKTYLALGVGHLWPQTGRWEDWMAKRDHFQLEKMCLVDAKEPGALHAVCNYRVLDSRKLPENGGVLSWVTLSPETGRTHQLRLQMASRDCPILGDGKYGRRPHILSLKGLSLHLHAHEVAFTHPQTGGVVHMKASLPAAFQATLEKYGLSVDLAPPKRTHDDQQKGEKFQPPQKHS